MLGETLDGKYLIKALLGSGAMGSVYEAEHTSTGRRVALKVITAPDLTRDSTVTSRFQREARAAGAIDTQHITQVLDAGVDPDTGRSYLVMELMTGEDLQQTIKRLGPLAPELGLRIVAQACLALQKAHKANVVHRDIKPANLFLARRDAGEVIVKLLDFGIAKVKMDQAQSADEASLTKTGSMIGSPLYMSPEQARGDVKNIDHRTDIWSLGVVLYQTLCGRTPYQHATALGELIIAICSEYPKNIQEIAPWVPAPIAAIVHRCLRHNKDDRYETAEEMFLACKAALPNGWSISEEMIISLEDTARKESSQKFALTNVLAGAQTAVVPHAGAATVGALTSSQNATVPPAAPRGNGALIGAGVAVAMALGGLGLFVATRPAHPPAPLVGPAAPAPQPTVAPTPLPTSEAKVTVSPVVSAAEPPPSAETSSIHRVKIVVAPIDATIEVDDVKTTLNKQGLLEISGKLGSNHRVKLTKGKSETTVDVAITEDGPSVPKIEIAPPGAKPAVTATASPTTPAPPKPGINPNFE